MNEMKIRKNEKKRKVNQQAINTGNNMFTKHLFERLVEVYTYLSLPQD